MIRRIQLLVLGIVLVVAALSTGLPFIFYLLYLAILVVGGSYTLTRLGLADLEAGYAVSQVYGHVGEQFRVTYTLRNASRLVKPWLEVHNPTSLPVAIPGRAIALGSRGERSWVAKVPLTRRGHYRIEPLQVRTGDPFGFFEASASVGQPVTLVVYPRIDRLPLWRLPAANLEGSHAAPERTFQTSPLATTVRPYAPGDGFNRIHWRSTARHGEIQVKEFDLEQTADVWIFLDLEHDIQTGDGEDSSAEVAIRAAASIADRSLNENRAVGLTAFGHRISVLPADRGGRQHLKVMQTLAAVEADGAAPLVEGLVTGLSRLRRGMTAVVITASLDPAWVRPLAGLRARGVACVVLTVGPRALPDVATQRHRSSADDALRPAAPSDEAAANDLRHALAEYQLKTYRVRAGRPLGEQLAG
jgi:uncharacterized protein (DUF58 family)